MADEVGQLVRWLRARGYEVVQQKRSHWRVMRDGRTVTTFGGTPNSPRFRKHVRATIARYERENLNTHS